MRCSAKVAPYFEPKDTTLNLSLDTGSAEDDDDDNEDPETLSLVRGASVTPSYTSPSGSRGESPTREIPQHRAKVGGNSWLAAFRGDHKAYKPVEAHDDNN
jgi:hypothetical protein